MSLDRVNQVEKNIYEAKIEAGLTNMHSPHDQVLQVHASSIKSRRRKRYPPNLRLMT